MFVDSTLAPSTHGWLPVVTRSYDTLASLAQAYHTTVDLLQAKNCLLNDQLVANSVLYVPAQPTATFMPCGAPLNWGYYTVIAGDTLYRISLLYRVTVPELRQANCLNTDAIRTGQTLRVPNVPTSTAPVSANTPTPTSLNPTERATETSTLTPTPAGDATETVTPTPTQAPALSATETPPAATEVPSPTTSPGEAVIPSATPTPES
jgi:LysM repeat protein